MRTSANDRADLGELATKAMSLWYLLYKRMPRLRRRDSVPTRGRSTVWYVERQVADIRGVRHTHSRAGIRSEVQLAIRHKSVTRACWTKLECAPQASLRTLSNPAWGPACNNMSHLADCITFGEIRQPQLSAPAKCRPPTCRAGLQLRRSGPRKVRRGCRCKAQLGPILRGVQHVTDEAPIRPALLG